MSVCVCVFENQLGEQNDSGSGPRPRRAPHRRRFQPPAHVVVFLFFVISPHHFTLFAHDFLHWTLQSVI